eukprot:3606756-Rhodomonas_salina.1
MTIPTNTFRPMSRRSRTWDRLTLQSVKYGRPQPLPVDGNPQSAFADAVRGVPLFTMAAPSDTTRTRQEETKNSSQIDRRVARAWL